MNYNVLYVDDEANNLFLFNSTFRNSYNVLTAQSAAEGLALLRDRHVQVVISDQRMPEVTGVQLLEQIKELYPDTIRIILTAYTDAEEIIEAINRGGIFYFVRKPYDKSELKALITRSLSFYNLRARNKELIKRLFSAINELETFYYRASHDIRGPIASQLGLIMLAKAENDPAEMEKYLLMLEASIQKLDQTLRKIESIKEVSDTPDEKIRFDVDDLLQEIHDVLADELNDKGIAVRYHVQPEAKVFEGNRSLFRTLFENLLENSIHFSDSAKAKRFIDVSVTKDSQFRFEVTDNGVGIEQSKVDNIFQAFYRGHQLSNGNGLGLYIVKKTVDAYGGTIKVTSEEGVGTKVSITFPVL